MFFRISTSSHIRALSSDDFNKNKISTENVFNRDYFANEGNLLSDETKNSDIEHIRRSFFN